MADESDGISEGVDSTAHVVRTAAGLAARAALERQQAQRDVQAAGKRLGADPAPALDAFERREQDVRRAAEEREKARLEEADGARLLLDAEHTDVHRPPRLIDAGEKAAGQAYDSADRRRDLAASLEGRADAAAVEARVVADTSQAQPAREAVAQRPRRTAVAKRVRGTTGRVRSQPQQPPPAR